jgi:hypothetical protein
MSGRQKVRHRDHSQEKEQEKDSRFADVALMIDCRVAEIDLPLQAPYADAALSAG